MKKITLSTIYFLFLIKLDAQTFLAIDTINFIDYWNYDHGLEGRFVEVDVSTCSVELYTHSQITLEDVTLFDMAQHPSTLYSIGFFENVSLPVDNSPELYSFEFYSIDFNGETGLNYTYDIIEDYSDGNFPEGLDSTLQALAIGSDSLIYAAGRGLYTQNTMPGYDFITLGMFPPEMQAKGDLAFRYGKLYMSTINNQLVDVNINNPAASKVVMTFPEGTYPIEAMATFSYSCDSVVTYAIGGAPDGSGSKIYILNPEAGTLEEICTTETHIFGATGPEEWILPECSMSVDLDADNSSGSGGMDYHTSTACFPDGSIVDTDAFILSEAGGVDSITITLTNIQNTGEEILATGNIGNVAMASSGDSTITLYNNCPSTIADFEQALQNIFYENNADNVLFGQRIVQIRVFYGAYSSQAAFTYIDVSSPGGMPIAEDISLCQGDVFVDDNSEYTIDTSFCNTVTSTLGCDSSYCINLSFGDTILIDWYAEICQGEFYDFEGNILEADTLVCLSFERANGCDSTVCLRLEVLENERIQSEEVCEGDIFIFNGNEYNQTGFYTDTFPAANGCDSLVSLELMVQPNVLSIEKTGSFCDNTDSLSLFAGDFATYEWSNGANTPEITIEQADVYSVNVVSAIGCPAVGDILIDESRIEVFTSFESPLCPNEASGFITIDSISGGETPYLYALNNEVFSNTTTFSTLFSEIYTLKIQDAAGCEIYEEITLEEPESFLNLGEDKTIKLGDSIFINPMTNILTNEIYWNPNPYLSCDTCLQTYIIPLTSSGYSLTLIDENGCSIADDIHITVDVETDVFVPTAFSPNGDGINDWLQIYPDMTVDLVHSFRIYNRWGELMYEAGNFAPNDDTIGWDGTFQGRDQFSSVYLWTMVIKRKDGVRQSLSGDVALIR